MYALHNKCYLNINSLEQQNNIIKGWICNSVKKKFNQRWPKQSNDTKRKPTPPPHTHTPTKIIEHNNAHAMEFQSWLRIETQMWWGCMVTTPVGYVSIIYLFYKELKFFIKYMLNYCYIHIASSFNIQR